VLILDSNNPGPRTYQTLVPNKELPGPGTIIALDTEFVSIRQPEIEVNSDGERATIRPIVYALARVSVIRGPSPAFLPEFEPGTPFIDDYIATSEPIVDYLTSFSGIAAGDLDPRTSPHNLVPLKLAYKKLWLLLNLGCSFLGHGLKQDFRVINIHVPKAQVIDTADHFFVAARLRKLSLAFLAWYLLKEDIQQETHDSIEDARTALKLHGKYLEFVDAGILETILQDIYKKGREMGFKPPQAKRDEITGAAAGGTTTTTATSGSESPFTPVKKKSGVLSAASAEWTPSKGFSSNGSGSPGHGSAPGTGSIGSGSGSPFK
jgi:PAB-dependent poly(A)-specific ribonuclease subunit 2